MNIANEWKLPSQVVTFCAWSQNNARSSIKKYFSNLPEREPPFQSYHVHFLIMKTDHHYSYWWFISLALQSLTISRCCKISTFHCPPQSVRKLEQFLLPLSIISYTKMLFCLFTLKPHIKATVIKPSWRKNFQRLIWTFFSILVPRFV